MAFKKTLFALIGLWSVPMFTSTAAFADNCKSIADPTARLACFDKASGSNLLKKQPVGDPATEAAKRTIVATKSRLFKDPYSLKDAAIGKPFPCLSGVGTCICIEANGKTSAGGYSGIQLMLLKITGPAESENLGEVFKPEICGKLAPFPQLNGRG